MTRRRLGSAQGGVSSGEVAMYSICPPASRPNDCVSFSAPQGIDLVNPPPQNNLKHRDCVFT